MNNNRSRLISLIAAAALLTGCSGLNQSSSSEKSETTTASTTTVENTTESASAESASEAATEAAKVEIGAPEKADINIGYLNSTAHLLAFVAQEEGYFKEEGLNVTLTQFSSASELINGIESDKLDVAFIGSVPTLTFQSQGHEVSIFGGAMTNGHGYVIKSEFADKDEAGVEILKGRNVASVKNSVQDAELQILLKNANIEIGEGDDKVNIVYFDSQKDAYAALLNSSIDAASVYSPYASLAKSQGYKVVYYCAHEKALENQPCCRQVAKTAALSSTPNTFIAIERAFIKAYHFTQSDHDKTIKDVKKYIDIEEDFIDTEVYGGYSVSSPDPDKKGTLTLKDTIIDLGYTNDYDIEPHYNTDIYKKALDSILAESLDDIYKSLEDHFNEFE
ncbi:MAG: ABC transporter substrate-binding protein [Ruminococcus sp.]|uniref:ABC transporter substrate-binding protein n=1 Tax=Ruminococcus sp. TaxID=41978 RepID=UPI001B28ABFF|nr:ABC transporter substrate-binding protein [Ruminococcus sp.]MBO7474557.1 ABC transporter substrate-binding protein [Ruminococcus sp.]